MNITSYFEFHIEFGSKHNLSMATELFIDSTPTRLEI
jgi:hypothetical protein